MSTAIDVWDRVWTGADLHGLPEDLDWRRVEIVDGMLVVSPQPSKPHAAIVGGVHAAVVRVLPPGLHVSQTLPVEIGATYRVPDVAVMRASALLRPGPAVQPSDLVLVVEVVSPSSVTTDRITKPAEYAGAGIPWYWRVETDPVHLVAHACRGDAYVEVGSWSATEVASIEQPFAIDIDLTSLLPR